MDRIKSYWRQIKKICFDIYVNGIGGSFCCIKFVRKMIYNSVGMHVVSKNINPKNYYSGRNFNIGKDCYIGYMNFFDAIDSIVIEDKCNIAMKCSFITTTHEKGDKNRRAGTNYTKGIVIREGTWIGANVVILPGVTVGKGCIIAAGSVVVDDCEENSVYAGVPAIKVSKMDN